MKKSHLFYLFVVFTYLSCSKQEQIAKDSKQIYSNITKPEDSIKKYLTVVDEIPDNEDNTSNWAACDYYPPTDPRSCNYVITDDEPSGINTTATYSNGMLNFPNLTALFNTMEALENADENYTGYDWAMGLYGGNLEKIDSLLDARGVDENSTFVNFENQFPGFVSMRKEVETAENNFLNNGGDPSSPNNPENRYEIADDIFRTMLNKDGAIKVENVIFKFFSNGVCYAILNGSMSIYNSMTNPINPEYYSYTFYNLDTVNVKCLTPKFLCDGSSGGEQLPGDNNPLPYPCNIVNYNLRQMGARCRLWYKTLSDPIYFNNGKNMSFSKIAVYNTFVYDVALSKIRYYKLKNGKWRPARASMSASVHNVDCSPNYHKSKSTKYRKFRRAAKRDAGTYFPVVGYLYQAAYWMFYNVATYQVDYTRYFIPASNNGAFWGDNYCKGTHVELSSQW